MNAYDDVIYALAIPDGAKVGRRIPKTLLLEHGAVAAGDKRQIREGIDGLDWVAALKPANIGVPAHRDATREYLEIAVLVGHLRNDAKATRLVEVIHRAIPYPVFLVTEQAGAVDVSLAHKRIARNEAEKTVLDGGLVGVPLAVSGEQPNATMREFLAGLAISAQPCADLYALYQSWIDRLEALQVARLTGRFSHPLTVEAASARRFALAEHARLALEIAELRAAAKREVQLARRADLNLTIQRLQVDLARAEAKL